MFDTFAEIPIQKRWRQQAHPMPVVVAIICRQFLDKEEVNSETAYLLIKRNNDPYNNYWALVGGKWDFGETLIEAARREVMEETGLETTFVGLRGLLSERVVPENDEDGEAAHFLILVCQLEATAGEAREQHEGAVAWFTAEEIVGLNAAGTIIPSDYLMLNQFVDTPALPIHEAEMVTKNINSAIGDVAELVRFEQI